MKAVRHIVTNGNVIKLCSLSQVGDKYCFKFFWVFCLFVVVVEF